MVQNGNHLAQQVRRNGIGNRFDRQMRGRQRNAQLLGSQHHHHFCAVRARFKKLGMAGKSHPRIINHPFMHRPGDQRGKFAAQAAITGACQRFHHIMTVFGTELSGNNGGTHRDRQQRQGACLLGERRIFCLIRQERQRQIKGFCSRLKHAGIGADHQLDRPAALGKLDDQIGTNPGRFAGSDNNTMVFH